MQSSSTVRLAGRVFGKCVLKRRIGKGGMARVFLAEHTLLRRRVAIKILSSDLTRDPDTFVAMQRRLAVTNLSDLDPSPVVYGLFATHPTAPERIALARSWARLAGVPEP